MSYTIAAHFKGREPTEQIIKSIVLSEDNGTKTALTSSLEKLKKEVNTFLTECIEKNKMESPDAQNILTIDEDELDSEEETSIEDNSSLRPNKVPKLV
ncbi:hypothetical protein GHT06_010800 [Daphnia sinensis]|uniref:Uncharacterized protein n=1 Tax=Daphnia sinensis TaxID=1820382 RepID=A0AAD5Q0S2_9CRUS|nr:hypothetical protein GHT06_010800 [Daphnia sinensis]